MDEADIVFLTIILSVMAGGLIGYVLVQSETNAYHEYTGEIISIEKKDWLFKTTSVTMKTYSESTVTFNVNGFHDFEIGKVYKIETKGKFWWFVPNLISSNEIQTTNPNFYYF